MAAPPKPKKTKFTFREGDWVSVPLRHGKRALGVIARKAPGHVLVGYFFRWPDHDDDLEVYVARLKPSDAVLIVRFGDAGLTHGTWKVVHSSGREGASHWPLPVFMDRNGVGPGATYTYDMDLFTPIPIVPREGDVITRDVGGWGAGAVEDAVYDRLKNDS